MFCKFLSQDIVNFSYEKLLFYSFLSLLVLQRGTYSILCKLCKGHCNKTALWTSKENWQQKRLRELRERETFQQGADTWSNIGGQAFCF